MKKEKDDKYMNFISKPEISFWIPIVTTTVLVALSWANLSGRVDLLTQKVDLILQNQNVTIKDLQDKYTRTQVMWGELSQRVTRLEK